MMIAVSIPSVLSSPRNDVFSEITMNVIAWRAGHQCGYAGGQLHCCNENIYQQKRRSSCHLGCRRGQMKCSGLFCFTDYSLCIPAHSVRGLTKQLFTDMGLTIAYSLCQPDCGGCFGSYRGFAAVREKRQEENYLSSALMRIYETVLDGRCGISRYCCLYRSLCIQRLFGGSTGNLIYAGYGCAPDGCFH